MGLTNFLLKRGRIEAGSESLGKAFEHFIYQEIFAHSRYKGLRSFGEEYPVKQLILVCNDPNPRQADKITILPWKIFLDKLWSGEIIK